MPFFQWINFMRSLLVYCLNFRIRSWGWKTPHSVKDIIPIFLAIFKLFGKWKCYRQFADFTSCTTSEQCSIRATAFPSKQLFGNSRVAGCFLCNISKLSNDFVSLFRLNSGMNPVVWLGIAWIAFPDTPHNEFHLLFNSGGNKRKLSTALALVGDPPVIFLVRK